MYQKHSISGNIVSSTEVFPGTITIENGSITQIEKGLKPHAENYSDSYILPGLIEIHGHFREPGFEQKGDVPHESKAAIAGGFTTVIDMPNTNPPTITEKLLDEKIETIYRDRSYCDYAFFLGVSKDSLSELEHINPKKIVGIKVFMAGHETTPTTIPDDETLAKICEIAAKRNLLVALHAEDQNIINELERKMKKTGRTDPALWSEIRPKEVVIKAVKRALAIGKTYGTKQYFLHLSTPEEFALIKRAKQQGQNVFGELVSYQLTFNTNDYKTFGNKIKVAPALRDAQTQDMLWEIFKTRQTDVLCSEHTPHEWETKNQPNVWKAQAGMPSIQETLPAIITNWVTRYGEETIEDCLMTLATLCAKNPAHIFGFSKKGEIAIGKDADMVIVDTKNIWRVKKEDILSKCGWSAYEDMELIGKPISTFLRGTKVYENDVVFTNPIGNMITPTVI